MRKETCITAPKVEAGQVILEASEAVQAIEVAEVAEASVGSDNGNNYSAEDGTISGEIGHNESAQVLINNNASTSASVFYNASSVPAVASEAARPSKETCIRLEVELMPTIRVTELRFNPYYVQVSQKARKLLWQNNYAL